MMVVRPTNTVFRSLATSFVAALHVLSNDQCDIARKFFAPTSVQNGTIIGEPFHDGTTRVPILQNAPAYLECSVRQIIDQGSDHAVLILEVVEAVCRERVKPFTMAESPWEYGG
jgi:flavin reductase (DIM6/NTAB) family NADH-FMN oxidoreductase RutF